MASRLLAQNNQTLHSESVGFVLTDWERRSWHRGTQGISQLATPRGGLRKSPWT